MSDDDRDFINDPIIVPGGADWKELEERRVAKKLEEKTIKLARKEERIVESTAKAARTYVRCLKCFERFQLTDVCKFNCHSKRKMGVADHCDICERVGKVKKLCNCGCGEMFRPSCRFRLKRSRCWRAIANNGPEEIYSLPAIYPRRD